MAAEQIDDAAFREQERRLSEQGRWDELLRLYEGRVKARPDAPDAGRLMARAADLARTRLNNPARAEDLYRRALAEERNASEALEGLQVLYESKGDLAALAEVLEERAAASGREPAAAGLWMALAEAQVRLGRPELAVLAFQRAGRADPARREALLGAFEQLLELGRYELALDTLDRARARFGSAGLADAYLAVGKALSDLPTDHPAALRAAQAALEIEPGHPAARALQQEVESWRGEWQERVRALRLKASQSRDRKEAARLSLCIALAHATFDASSEARKRAKEALDRALLLWPGMPPALDALERIAADTDDWKGLEKLFERLAADARERPAQVELLQRLAVLRLQRFDDRAGALEALLRASALDPARPAPVGMALELLLDAGRADEAASLLERHLSALPDRRAQRALRLRAAALLMDGLGDMTRARPHLEAALQADPGCSEAARRLALIYDVLGEPARLLDMLERTLPPPSRPGERARALQRIAELQDQALRRPADAARSLSRALVLDPSVPLADSLERQAEAARAFEPALAALVQAAELHPEKAPWLLVRAAGVAEGRLGRAHEATALLRRALELSPGDTSANAALARLLARTGQASELAERLREQLARARGEERGALLGRALDLLERADPAPAAALERVLLDEAGEDPSLLERIAGSSAAGGRFELFAEAAERLGRLAPSEPARREWRARRAQVLDERLGRRAEAAEIWLALLREEPERPGVRPALERIAASGVLASRIAEALLPLQRAQGDWEQAAASLQALAGESAEPAARAEWLRQLAAIQETHLGDARAALTWAQQAFLLDPHPQAAAELERLAAALSAQGELAQAFVDLARALADRSRALDLYLRAAALFESVSDPRRALEALRCAQAIPSGRAQATRALQRLASAFGLFAELEQALRERLAEEPAAAAELMPELALAVERQGRPAEAARWLEQALEHGAAPLDILPRLAALYEQAGDSAGLKSALERELSSAEAAGQKERAARLRVRLARLLEGAGGDKARLLDHWTRVLAERPLDPEALAALERLLQSPEVRAGAARVLAPAWEALKEHRKLIWALEILAESAPGPEEQAALLARAAALHLQALRQPELAFATSLRALRLCPGDAGLREAARHAAEACGELSTLVEVGSDIAQEAPPAAAADLLRVLAPVCERDLKRPDEAARLWREVLRHDPEAEDALRALHRIGAAQGDERLRAEAAAALCRLARDPAERAGFAREAAALLEAQGALDEAASCLRLAVDLDAADVESLRALERIYQALDRPEELAAILALRRDREGDAPGAREAALRLAQLQRTRLGDWRGALEQMRALIARDAAHAGARAALESWARSGEPGAFDALQLLDPLLASDGEHERRVAIRQALLDAAPSVDAPEGAGAGPSGEPAPAQALLREIARLQEAELGRPDLAFAALARAFARGPRAPSLIAELERVARLQKSLQPLAALYQDAAERLRPREPERIGLLHRAAELWAELGQTDPAVALYRALLEEQPEDEKALEALSRLYEAAGLAEPLAEIRKRQAARAQQPSERAHLLLKAAAAALDAGRAEQAEALARGALQAAPQDREALALLDRALEKLARPLEQADVVRQQAELASEPAARVALLLRRAALLESAGDLSGAVAVWSVVLDLAASEPTALAGLERALQSPATALAAAARLEPIYRARADWRRLADVLEIRVSEASGAARSETLRELADLRESLGQRPLALQAWLRCFQLDPADDEVRARLERAASQAGAYEDLAAAYEDALERNPDEALALALLRRLAALWADRLGAPERSAAALEEVVRRAPQDLAALDSLVGLYRRLGQSAALASALRRRAELEREPEARRALLSELAALCEEALGDVPAAIDAWQQVAALVEEDAAAEAALARLLWASGRLEELSARLEARAARAARAGLLEEALQLEVSAARLKLERLGEGRAGLDALAAVLARRPGHPGAVEALEACARSDSPLRAEAAALLEPVFAQAGDALKQVQALEVLASAGGAPQRAATLLRMAALYAGPLASPDMAFVSAARALRAAPEDPRALEAAVRYGAESGSQEELAALLGELAESTLDESARAALLRARARALAAGEPASAAEAFEALLAVVPGDAEALAALAELNAQLERWPALLEVLRRTLALAAPERHRELLARMAQVQLEHLGDAAGAVATLRRQLEIAPDDAEALARLEAACLASERWAELADALARRIDLARRGGRRDEETGLRFRLAQVREEHLFDSEGALALYRQVLEARPGFEEALQRLQALAARDEDAAALLIESLQACKAFDRLAAFLEERAGAAQGSARSRLLQELARVRQESQNRPDLAFLALCRAFREEPADRALRTRLEQAAEQAEAHEELAALYEEELSRLEGEDAAEVCLTLAGLQERRLKDSDLAIAWYERARRLSPQGAAVALPALSRLYREAREYEQLADVLQERIALTESAEDRAALLFRLGEIAAEQLEPPQPERAARAFEQVLELVPGHLPAARALARLCEAGARFDRLFELLDLQRAHARGGEREKLTARMAELAEQQLGDRARAIALWEEVLGLNPASQAAYDALEALHEREGDREALAALLQRRLGATSDPRERVRLHAKRGEALAALGQDAEAIAAFRAALERDPRHRGSLQALRALYERAGDLEQLAGVLRRLIALQEDAASARAVRLQLAEVLARAGRREEAIEAARRAFDADGGSAEELQRAEELFRALSAPADLVRVMAARAERQREAGDVAGAVATLYAVAEVHVAQAAPGGRRDAAAPVYERILELAPGERLAFEALKAIYAASGAWRPYAAACERALPGLAEASEKMAVLKDMGAVYETRLGHKDLAFLAWCRALALNPADDEALQAAERLAAETGSYEELATVYEEVASRVEPGPLAERLLRALARVQDEKLDQPEQAEASLRAVLEIDPANRGALEALSAMFARRGKDRDYLVSLEQRYEVAGSLEERKALLAEIARTEQVRLSRPEEAAAAWRRSLELQPDRESFEELEKLLRGQGRHEELAEVLAWHREYEPDPALKIALQCELAAVYEHDLGDDEAAVASYTQVLQDDPQNPRALAALEGLYIRLDRARELLDVYERQLLGASGRERVSLLFKAAAVWEEKLHDRAQAATCLESALALEPDNALALQNLVRLRRLEAEESRTAARWEELLRACERQLAATQDPRAQCALLIDMGEVLHRELHRADRAAQTFHRALDLDPVALPALHALGVLYERSGNWPQALEMIGREAEALGATPAAAELHQRAGRIYEEMLLDPASARAAYQRALEADPGYLPALRRLKALTWADKDWDGYLAVLRREAENTSDPEERAGALLEVGRFYLDAREDPDEAARAFEAALALRPDLLEAARPLSEIYQARGEWPQAEAMLDKVVAGMASADPIDAADLARQLYRLGTACAKQGKAERALAAWERAYAMDATYQPAAEAFAHALGRAGRFGEAVSVLQAILIHHREALTDFEVVELYAQLGDLHRRLGAPDRARKEYERALALDAGHEPSLRALVELNEEQESWPEAFAARSRLAAGLEGEERYAELLAAGALARDKLADPYRAADAFAQAHALMPQALEPLDALRALYRQTRQGARAAEVIERMLGQAEVQADPARACGLLLELGTVLRDEVRDWERAAEAFNRALDLDCRFVQAFTALESMLGEVGQWEALEQNYLRMIQRLPKTEETHRARMALFRALAELYERGRKNLRASRQAWEVVARGLPQDPVAAEKLAELTSLEPGEEREGIAAWRRALEIAPDLRRAARHLARLHARARDYDGAFVAAQVSAFLLGDRGPEQDEVLAKLTPWARRRESVLQPLRDEDFARLLAPGAGGPLGALLTALAPLAGPHLARRLSTLGIDPGDHRVDPAADLFALGPWRAMQRALGLERVELYSPFLAAARNRKPGAAPDKGGRLLTLASWPISVEAGGWVFGEHAPKALAFEMARALSFARPELCLARLAPPERLAGLVEAARVRLAPGASGKAAGLASPADLKLVDRLEGKAKAALAAAAQALPQDFDARAVHAWVEGAERTALRAAALLCADLEVASARLAAEPDPASSAQRERRRDLVVFCLSGDFAALRQTLGLDVQIPAAGNA